MVSPEDWQTIPDILEAAQLAMSRPAWAFSGSGPESETTVRRNRAVFDGLALMPRVLRGANHRDLSTTFLGHKLSLPVMLAPVGSIQMFYPQGAQGPARVANRVGTVSYVATNSIPSLEEVRKVSEGPMVYQLYIYGGREWQQTMLRRVENAGYDALCLTVDNLDAGNRDRRHANRMQWSGDLGQGEQIGEAGASSAQRAAYMAGFTWEDLAWIRDHTKLPIILKGVLSVQDVEMAIEHGVNVIHVSNHGGRRQDQLPSTIEVLPGIVKKVAGRAEVVVDSGFMRGTDIIKGLALGASVVLIGKLMIWALAAGGEAGLERALDLLQREISATMANIGAHSIPDLTPELVVPSFAPPPAPWPVEPMDVPAF